MDEFFAEGILWLICNLIGGTIRWFCGSIWRTLLNKPKLKYKEYLFGPEKSKNHYDIHGHYSNNVIITIIFIGLLIFVIK